jgi:hypothetical protein
VENSRGKMEIAKRNRTASRRQATKLMRQCEELKGSQDEAVKLKTFKIQMQEKREELKRLDQEIINMNEKEDDDLEEEFEGSQKYQSALIEEIQKIDNILEKMEEKGRSIDQVFRDPAQKKQEVKLPKITLPIFNGDIEEWTSFWQIFYNSVHQREELTDIEKMTYLISLLQGEAARMVSGFTVTAENYNNVVELLKDQYANHDRLVDVNIKKIGKLSPVKDVSQLNLFKKLVMDINVHLRNLVNLGVDINNDVLLTKLKELVPSEILLLYSRQKDVKETTEQFVKFLQVELRHRENALPISDLNPAATPVQHRAAAPVPWRPPMRSTPGFWSTPKVAPRTTPVPGFRFPGQAVPETPRKICYRCGRPGHVAKDCRTS